MRTAVGLLWGERERERKQKGEGEKPGLLQQPSVTPADPGTDANLPLVRNVHVQPWEEAEQQVKALILHTMTFSKLLLVESHPDLHTVIVLPPQNLFSQPVLSNWHSLATGLQLVSLFSLSASTKCRVMVSPDLWPYANLQPPDLNLYSWKFLMMIEICEGHNSSKACFSSRKSIFTDLHLSTDPPDLLLNVTLYDCKENNTLSYFPITESQIRWKHVTTTVKSLNPIRTSSTESSFSLTWPTAGQWQSFYPPAFYAFSICAKNTPAVKHEKHRLDMGIKETVVSQQPPHRPTAMELPDTKHPAPLSTNHSLSGHSSSNLRSSGKS